MKRNGFTLVEVMIVIGLVALLAAIAIPNLLKARISANDAVAQSTLKAIGSALENYMAIHANYPTTTDSLLGVTPPYLNVDYFSGTFSGFTYASTLSQYSYSVFAHPVSLGRTGTTTFTLATGGVLSDQ